LLYGGFCLYNFAMPKSPKKTAVGRPKKQPGEARDYKLQVRLTEAERKLLDDAAQSKSLDTSAWVRSEALALARQLLRGTDRQGTG
jgi:hypothetical protein